MIGQGAGKALNDGDCNVFFGFCAGESETTGNENVFIGKKAGNCSLGNNCNTFIGNETGRNFCRGAFNVAIGEASLYGGDNGVGNTAKLSVGIVSAYQLYGDGSNLTGAGFSPDDQ